MDSVFGCVPALGGRSLLAVAARAVTAWPHDPPTVVLPRAQRLRSGADFTAVLRLGRRCSTSLLSVHVLFGDSTSPARAGVVVAKSVGIAVVRNRVKRRLRVGLHNAVNGFRGGRVVVRALPEAAQASSAELHGDLWRCLERLRAHR